MGLSPSLPPPPPLLNLNINVKKFRPQLDSNWVKLLKLPKWCFENKACCALVCSAHSAHSDHASHERDTTSAGDNHLALSHPVLALEFTFKYGHKSNWKQAKQRPGGLPENRWQGDFYHLQEARRVTYGQVSLEIKAARCLFGWKNTADKGHTV